jgi:phosphopantothenoylcysteine decarboxylase/phosphopantothenate--cysteine ligase
MRPQTSQCRPGTDSGSDRPSADLAGYELLVCVTGGIAAYKTAQLVSALVQRGCGVTVAMTESAQRFVGPTTFRALTGHIVATSLWDAASDDQQHLNLSERSDLILVAPATANIIGKLAGGIADDLVSTLLLGADCPVVLAPAMNTRMWQHPAVQANVARLREFGCEIAGPGAGWLACRTEGEGRMLEPDELVEIVVRRLTAAAPRGVAVSRKSTRPQ